MTMRDTFVGLWAWMTLQRTVWVDLDTVEGRTRRSLELVQPTSPLPSVTLRRYGTYFLGGPPRFWRGRPVFRFLEWNSAPVVYVARSEARAEHIVFPPRAVSVTLETNVYSKAFADRLSFWLYVIVGLLLLILITLGGLMAGG